MGIFNKYRSIAIVWGIFLLFLLALFLSSNRYLEKRNLTFEQIISAEKVYAIKNITFTQSDSGGFPNLSYIDQTGKAQFGIALDAVIRGGVLEIDFFPQNELWKNELSIKVESQLGENFNSNGLEEKWINLRANNLSYRIPLDRKPKDRLIVNIEYAGHNPGIAIEQIRLAKADIYDLPIAAIFNGLLIFLVMFVPGALFGAAFQFQFKLPFGISAFLFTLAISSIGIFLDRLFEWPLAVPIVSVLIPTGLLFFSTRRKILLVRLTKPNESALKCFHYFTYLFIAIVLSLSFFYPGAMKNISEQHIARDYTFRAFAAHDSIFQYANAKSILENNFAKYYGNGKLIYNPEDREILPAIGYAGVLRWLELISPSTNEYYFNYVVYYLFAHLLILMAIYYWVRPLGDHLALLCCFVISTSPFFWVLAAVGWFKLTGAAMLISGLYLLRQNLNKISFWIIAGVLFGLAKNFHGGNILVLPLLLIWVSSIALRQKLKPIFTFLAVCSCLFATLITAIPWNLFVGFHWNTGTHSLFSEHYLNGFYVKDSLLKSFGTFFSAIPLEDQLTLRWQRTIDMLNPGWMIEDLSHYWESSGGFIASWMRISGTYVFVSVLPALLILSKIKIDALISKNQIELPLDYENKKLWFTDGLWVVVIGAIGLMFASYNIGVDAGITWNFPQWLIIGIIISCVARPETLKFGNSAIWLVLGGIQTGLILAQV